MTLEKNPKKKYDEHMKNAALYMFIIGGRMMYEHLVLNLNLPSISTVLKHLQDEEPLVEGQFRLQQLKQHIAINNYTSNVFLSSDATRIQSTLKYVSKSDTILGLVLPLDDKTGNPISNYFKFKNVEDVQRFIETHEMAENANIIVAKCLNSNSISFIIAIWGTDNKFKSESVVKQWRGLKSDLKKIGIEAIGKFLK